MSKNESVIEGTAIDPVCGMSVAIDGAKHIAPYEGAEHYFCSSRCHDKFLADPELYLSGAHLNAVEEVPEGTIYTCPMHPEIHILCSHVALLPLIIISVYLSRKNMV